MALCFGAQAVETRDAASPYQVIHVRNAFGLQAPVVVTSNVPATPQPKPTIILQGFSTVDGRRVAFLKVVPPGPNAKAHDFFLRENEAVGTIALLKIDESHRTVSIQAFGEVTNLTFAENGPKAVAVAALPAGK